MQAKVVILSVLVLTLGQNFLRVLPPGACLSDRAGVQGTGLPDAPNSRQRHTGPERLLGHGHGHQPAAGDRVPSVADDAFCGTAAAQAGRHPPDGADDDVNLRHGGEPKLWRCQM